MPNDIYQIQVDKINFLLINFYRQSAYKFEFIAGSFDEINLKIPQNSFKFITNFQGDWRQ